VSAPECVVGGQRARDDRLLEIQRLLLLLEVGGPLERVLAALLEGRLLQRPVHRVQQEVVLPERDAEADQERRDADDQPRAQLVEVLDEAQALVVADRPERGAGHASFRAGALGAPLGDDVALERRLLALGTAESGLGLAAVRRLVALVVVLVVVAAALAADRVLELAHAGAELLAEARKPLGAEDEQDDHQKDDQLCWSDVGHRETPLVVGR
jgi:hypothetical protein